MDAVKDKSADTEKLNQIAALANIGVYNSTMTKKYIDGAPHVKHLSLRRLYSRLATQIYDSAKLHIEQPRVLDLGAGEGSTTLVFLGLGAKVVATDISRDQLDALQNKCGAFRDNLNVICGDTNDVLKSDNGSYDIIVACSFLHHIPNYLGLIEMAIDRLGPGGQFFSFQDPLRYDSLSLFARAFSKLAYFSWRALKGDVVGGIKRYIRRSRGIYLDDCPEDNAEYHVARNGVDQDAIVSLLSGRSMDYEIKRYFSTQNGLFQWLGSLLGVKNTFSIVGKKRLGN